MTVKTPKLSQAAHPNRSTNNQEGGRTLVGVKVSAPQPKRVRVKIGGVYVTGDKPSAAQVRRAVADSTDMLERLGRKIVRPGVQLKAARDIPLFSADPDKPDRFLRELNGKIERGVLENGAFKVVD